MSAGMIAQHVVAIGLALGAAAWLIARTRSPKHRGEGPCATCAAAHAKKPARVAQRPESSTPRLAISKK
jgi:hypothetical protein